MNYVLYALGVLFTSVGVIVAFAFPNLAPYWGTLIAAIGSVLFVTGGVSQFDKSKERLQTIEKQNIDLALELAKKSSELSSVITGGDDYAIVYPDFEHGGTDKNGDKQLRFYAANLFGKYNIRFSNIRIFLHKECPDNLDIYPDKYCASLDQKIIEQNNFAVYAFTTFGVEDIPYPRGRDKALYEVRVFSSSGRHSQFILIEKVAGEWKKFQCNVYEKHSSTIIYKTISSENIEDLYNKMNGRQKE